MAKYCPKCGKENIDSAGFCEDCGEELPEYASSPSSEPRKPSTKPNGGWWGQQSSGVKAAIAIAGLCCIGLVVVVLLFGVFLPDENTQNTQSTNTANTISLSKTFSKSGITFNYPSDWETKKTKSSTDNTQNIGVLVSPSDFGVFVDKEDIPAGVTVKEAYENTKKNFKKDPSTLEFIGESQKTINGIKAYEMIFTLDAGEDKINKCRYLVMGKNDDVVYYLQFMCPESSYNSNEDVMDDIINTIKIE